MSAAGAGERLRRLIFQWPGRSVSLAFPLIFLGVIILHALTFYGFQVVYPPVSSVAPPPGEVMLLTPDNPAHAKLLEWVDAQSPALAPRLQEQAPTGLEKVSYKPSYTDVQTLPKPAPTGHRDTVFPPAYEPVALLQPRRVWREASGEAVRTTLRLSGSLAGRMPGSEAEAGLRFEQRSENALLPTHLLIGVNAHGRVLYTFLQKSSGSTAMDAQAEAAVRKRRFLPRDKAAVEWGLATIAWGEDAMTLPPASQNAEGAEEGGRG